MGDTPAARFTEGEQSCSPLIAAARNGHEEVVSRSRIGSRSREAGAVQSRKIINLEGRTEPAQVKALGGKTEPGQVKDYRKGTET